MKLFRLLTIGLAMLSVAQVAVAQQEEGDDLFDMSLEELMDIDIYSVSKKKESLFEAPLSSTTITAEEIMKAGITSIPEAMRLVPGVIVREISNGNYDIHLRGLDNLSRYSDASTAGNQITLVMIDGRPVFNNNLGGIVWESLPVGLIDLDRIEVVRGPSAPLYGPNAVAGVINLITKKAQQNGLFASSQANIGADTKAGGARVGYRVNDRFDITLSGNVQMRDRLDDQYFNYATGEFTDVENVFSEAEVDRYMDGDTEEALSKTGVNLFANYNPSEDFHFGVQLGYQDATAQRPFRANRFTPFSKQTYESVYANASLNYKKLSGRFSFTNGSDDVNSVYTQFPTGTEVMLAYDYTNIDTYLEYALELNDKLTLTPGVFYQRSTYGDEGIIPAEGFLGAINGENTIRTFSGSLRADFAATDKLRLLGAGRIDKFSSPDDAYFSYQFAATYDIDDKNIIRAVASRSNSGAFQAQNFLDIREDIFPGFSAGFIGNENLELFQVQLFELGYRSKFMDNLEFNAELFYQTTQNSNDIVQDVTPTTAFAQFTNLDIEATQVGATFSMNFIPTTQWQIKPFVTVQKTETEKLPTGLNTANADPVNNIENTIDADNEQTPSVFGGLYVNFSPTSKWNLNLNAYYIGEQTQYSFYDFSNPANTLGEIDGKVIMNAKVAYSISNKFNVFVNGRNILNSDSREFYGADRNGMQILGGFNFQL